MHLGSLTLQVPIATRYLVGRCFGRYWLGEHVVIEMEFKQALRFSKDAFHVGYTQTCRFFTEKKMCIRRRVRKGGVSTERSCTNSM